MKFNGINFDNAKILKEGKINKIFLEKFKCDDCGFVMTYKTINCVLCGTKMK
jgi:uncharacterized OB-fold protein